jgi:hypothetical protein
MPATSYVNRVFEREGRRVHVGDFGGEGPLLLLWHRSGVDATIREAAIPNLAAFRVMAQDLPGHRRSSISCLSVGDAIADGDAVVADLGLGAPIPLGPPGSLALPTAPAPPPRVGYSPPALT